MGPPQPSFRVKSQAHKLASGREGGLQVRGCLCCQQAPGPSPPQPEEHRNGSSLSAAFDTTVTVTLTRQRDAAATEAAARSVRSFA